MNHALPKISSEIKLARLLEISSRELFWLANQRTRFSTDDSMAKHYQFHWVRKRNVGWRLIEAPRRRLKMVQRRLVDEVLGNAKPHSLSFGFRKGHDVIDFVKPHLSRPVCLRLDLKDFFPSIGTGRVFGLMRSLGYRRSVAHLIALLTTVRTSERILTNEHPEVVPFPNRWSRIYSRRHLPQGAPSSPTIANLCAYGLDIRLAGLARSLGGVHYTRYADDLLFSGDEDLARQAGRLKALIGAIAIDEGFEPNFHKWRVMRSSQRQFATGVVLNEGMNLERRAFDRLKATLFNCAKSGPASQNRLSHPNFRQHLDGRVQWVERLNATRGAKLRAIFEKINW